MPKVLYIVHNHPSERPGGVETYSIELYEGMRSAGEFDPLLLANRRRRGQAPGIVPSPLDPNQYFFDSSDAAYDMFMGAAADKSIATKHFRDFLLRHRPDVVHFQHSLFLGYDLIREARVTLPHVPIVYTLHEFLPICHNNGQMVTTEAAALCERSTPDRCHACFPDIRPEAFSLRKRFIQSQFRDVSLFVTPSNFLRDRYIEWGLPADRIRCEEYGRHPVTPAEADADTPARTRVGFFGQLTAFKGVHVLLEAVALLQREGGTDIEVLVHGANLELQPKAFQLEFRALLDQTRDIVRFVGRYDPSTLPRLMAAVDWVVVPSIWWENSPLVIQEAFAYGRPVICSGIGGMREKVADGVNGLHVPPGDAAALAAALRRAATTPGLCDTLRRGIPPVHAMGTHVQTVIAAYRSMLAEAAAAL